MEVVQHLPAKPLRRSGNKTGEHWGKKAEVKIFYGTAIGDVDDEWLEYAAPSLPEPKKIKFESAAIQVFKRPVFSSASGGNVTKYSVSHIRIQSPLIRKELHSHLEKYDFDLNLDYVHINFPFKVLFFARDDIVRLSQTAEHAETREHLDLLRKHILEEELGSIIDEYEKLMESQEITFQLFWTIYPKGALIIGINTGFERGFRVKDTTKATDEHDDYFEIDFEALHFTGFHFGLKEYRYRQYWFLGKRKITSFDFIPYLSLDSPEEIWKSMTERGEKILGFQGIHHMQYDGAAFERRASKLLYWDEFQIFEVQHNRAWNLTILADRSCHRYKVES